MLGGSAGTSNGRDLSLPGQPAAQPLVPAAESCPKSPPGGGAGLQSSARSAAPARLRKLLGSFSPLGLP